MAEGAPRPLRLWAMYPDGSKLSFKVSLEYPLRKLVKEVLDAKGLSSEAHELSWRGTRIAAQEWASVGAFDMKHDDELSVVAVREEERGCSDRAASSSDIITIKVRTFDDCLSFKARPGVTFRKLAAAFCARKGVKAVDYIFYFDGDMVSMDSSLDEIGLSNGDVIDAVKAQSGNIGIFVSERDSQQLNVALGPASLQRPMSLKHSSAASAPGAEWLMEPLPTTPAPPRKAVRELVAAAAQQRVLCSAVVVDRTELLCCASRAALVARVDAAWALTHGADEQRSSVVGAQCSVDVDSAVYESSPTTAPPLSLCNDPAVLAVASSVAAGSKPHDFKLLLPTSEVEELLGEAALVRILAVLGAVARGDDAPPHPALATSVLPLPPLPAPPPLSRVTFALRRTTATGAWIGWHRDDAGATVQVPLSATRDTVGGTLLFALPLGKIVTHKRIAGALVAHHGDVLHGVTRLVAGTRYGLYALLPRVGV